MGKAGLQVYQGSSGLIGYHYVRSLGPDSHWAGRRKIPAAEPEIPIHALSFLGGGRLTSAYWQNPIPDASIHVMDLWDPGRWQYSEVS
jgi:hypothetical protein